MPGRGAHAGWRHPRVVTTQRGEGADLADAGQHGGAQPGRRLLLGEGAEGVGGGGELGDLGAAVGTTREVLLEQGALALVERVDGVGTGEVVQVGAHAGTPIVSRSRMRPSRIRVLAVPGGRSRRRATSVCVYPPR